MGFCVCACLENSDSDSETGDILFPPIEKPTKKASSAKASGSSSVMSSMEYASRKKGAIGFKRFRSNETGKITELFFNNCGIEEIPEEVFEACSLEILWLRDNDIRGFSKRIEGMPFLHTLWLSGNKFEKLPPLPSGIVNLYIDQCLLNDLTGIGKYTKLEKLDLSGCMLETLPEEIGNLVDLRHLSLHENRLHELPDGISKLVKLEKLSLHSNRLTHLPDGFGNIGSDGSGGGGLSWLSLHFNMLETLPPSFGHLVALQRLSLHHNRLYELPKGFEGCCENIQVMSLFRNNLRVIDGAIFGALKACKKLSLQQNDLEEIPNEAKEMTELEEIWLYENRMKEVPNVFNEMPSLKTVWFHSKCGNITNKNIEIK